MGECETMNDDNSNIFSGGFKSDDDFDFDDDDGNSSGKDGDGLEGGRNRRKR